MADIQQDKHFCMVVNLRKLRLITSIFFLLLASSCENNSDFEVREIVANSSDKTIVVWGHSAAFIIEPYLESLLINELPNYTLVKRSVRGETILQIAARQGSIPCIFNGEWIYDEISQIPTLSCSVLLSSYNGEEIEINTEFGFNPCSIQGFEGILKKEEGKYYFTPYNRDNKELECGNSHFIMPNEASTLLNAKINVFWCDQEQDRKNIDNLVDIYEIMTDFTGNGNYLIVGSIRGDRESHGLLERKLEDHFKEHYFNAREYLVQEALDQSFNMLISNEDNERLSQGKVPSFLMEDDDVHLNAIGASLVASKLFQIITAYYI